MEISRQPQNIDKENWYYEEKKGINLVHEIRVRGRYTRTDQILIPKKLLKESFKRMFVISK